MNYYAHSLPTADTSKWEPMEAHLSDVADRAAAFAAAFQAAELGRLLGVWHDIGKYSAAFQNRLKAANGLEASVEDQAYGKVDHSTAGAQHAIATLPGAIGRILAYCIAGHHGGLPDNVDKFGSSGLADRLKKSIPDWSAAPNHIRDGIKPSMPSLQPAPIPGSADFTAAFFCRMLFSCLVDADYLATESFMRPEQSCERASPIDPTFAELLDRLSQYSAGLANSTREINQHRAAILAACRRKAELPSGMFSLTVPTGGGKTLSSLAFALTHATKHDLRRVIYAIPYTSIIEQNADVFRTALGDLAEAALIEHHSNLDPDHETVWGRLAAENWDAPLIVTTNVQFFESLFASKPSRCRKLHRVARSVIILDECQTLPVELLKPTLAAMQELVLNYGCTIVLCTATQPAIRKSGDFPIGLPNVREIIDDPPQLAAALRRTKIEPIGKLEDSRLVERLAGHEQVLCIVNTKGHAAALFTAMHERTPDGMFHLSTNMCAAHRSVELAKIRKRLELNQSCRVVSTQLIEAGVDVDFPVVYRALAGLDSVTQAAGRCNREGKSTVGHVFLFETDVRPPHEIRQAAETTIEVLQDYPDLMHLDAIEQFFRLRYWLRKDEWDKHTILSKFQLGKDAHFQFREVAELYRLIADATVPVLVRYDTKAAELIDKLSGGADRPSRELLRKLQRYTVSVHRPVLQRLAENQVMAQVQEQYWILMNESAYHPSLGLSFESSGFDPKLLQV